MNETDLEAMRKLEGGLAFASNDHSANLVRSAREEITSLRAEIENVHKEFNGRIDRLNEDNNRLRAELADIKAELFSYQMWRSLK